MFHCSETRFRRGFAGWTNLDQWTNSAPHGPTNHTELTTHRPPNLVAAMSTGAGRGRHWSPVFVTKAEIAREIHVLPDEIENLLFGLAGGPPGEQASEMKPPPLRLIS